MIVSTPRVRIRNRVGFEVPAVVVPVRVHSPNHTFVRLAIYTTAPRSASWRTLGAESNLGS